MQLFLLPPKAVYSQFCNSDTLWPRISLNQMIFFFFGAESTKRIATTVRPSSAHSPPGSCLYSPSVGGDLSDRKAVPSAIPIPVRRFDI